MVCLWMRKEICLRQARIDLSEEWIFRGVVSSGHGEAVAEFVEHRADDEFRLRVPAPDARHHLTALLGGEDVGHWWGKL